MSTSTDADVTSFSFDRAEEVARHYQSATRIRCHVIDADGRPVVGGRRMSGPVRCGLCRTLEAASGRVTNCTQAHLYGSFEAMRFGGRYTYFCPLSLTHLSAPLLSDGVMVGAFVAGPVLLIDPAEYVADEIATRYDLSAPDARKAERALGSIEHVTPARAHALAEQLLYSASWACGADVARIVEEQDRLSHESNISVYIQHLKTMGGDTDHAYPTQKERELLEHTRAGEREAARLVLTELLAQIRFSTGEDVEQLKARALELTVLLSRAALDGGADPESVFGLNYSALAEIHSFTDAHTVSAWLARMTDRFLSFVFDVRDARHRDVILKAMRFIRENLSARIGLDDVASSVRLSGAYFSRLFREETGETFMQHLARVRVERARQLLAEGSREIIDIASETGFADQSHFSRVFKKLTGTSPLRFRREHGVPGAG